MGVFYYCTHVGSESTSKLIEWLIIEQKNYIINMKQDLSEIPLLNLIIILSVLMLLILVYVLWSERKSETHVFAI